MISLRVSAAAALLLFAAVASSIGQSSSSGTSRLQEEIVARERAELEALKSGDYDAFAALIADDAVFVDARGTATKAEVVRNVSAIRLKEFSMADVRFVPLSADSGLIAYRLTESGTIRDREFTARALASALWVRRNGRWQCVFSQETPAR